MPANKNITQLVQQATTDPTSLFYTVTGGNTDKSLPLSVLFNSPAFTGTVTAPLGTFIASPVTGTDVSNYHFSRTASYTGGTPGFTNNTVRIDHNVGANVTDYEWGFLSVLNNSATGGQNVAVYGQGNRQTTGTGPTWGGVMEVRETVAIANPTSGLVGLEVDNRSNGTDTNNARIGVDVAITRYNTSGAATAASWGYRVQTNRDTSVTVKVGYGFDTSNTNVTVGFDTSTATISQAAFKMAAGQALALDANAVYQIAYSGGLQYAVSGVQKFLIRDSGGVAITDSTAENASLTLTNTQANGVGFKMVGNGGTTPSKTFRVQAGSLGIINDAFNQVIFTLTDGGSLSVTGSMAPSTTAGIVGTTLADNANAGSVGEELENTSSALALTSTVGLNTASISLTAGDWDVTGSCAIVAAGGGVLTQISAGVNTTSATLPATPLYGNIGTSLVANGNATLTAPTRRINISTTTTVYLVAQANFSSGSATAQGYIMARRRR